MRRFLQNDRGFTLVELMVVVAIIGILSAVAIPNFKKYQAKSKTSEAKLGLSALYSSETALYSDYSSYATCLEYAGFAPNPAYYAIGFNAGNGTANGNVVTNGGTGCNSAPGDQFVWPAEKMIENTKVDTIADSNATVPDGGGEFIAQAEGRISEGGASGDNDIWQINQDKEVEHIQAGY